MHNSAWIQFHPNRPLEHLGHKLVHRLAHIGFINLRVKASSKSGVAQTAGDATAIAVVSAMIDVFASVTFWNFLRAGAAQNLRVNESSTLRGAPTKTRPEA